MYENLQKWNELDERSEKVRTKENKRNRNRERRRDLNAFEM